MVKRKIVALKEILRRYESQVEYLGGYRIEGRFSCRSLRVLVNSLTESFFTLQWIHKMIARARGSIRSDTSDWRPITIPVQDFLEHLRHALRMFTHVFQSHLHMRNEQPASKEIANAVLDLYNMFGYSPKPWDKRGKNI